MNTVGEAIYKATKEISSNNEDHMPMIMNSMELKNGWQMLMMAVPDEMIERLLDRGRIVPGIGTLVLRQYLTVPQCKHCLRYGHETCATNICCFRCGSTRGFCNKTREKDSSKDSTNR